MQIRAFKSLIKLKTQQAEHDKDPPGNTAEFPCWNEAVPCPRAACPLPQVSTLDSSLPHLLLRAGRRFCLLQWCLPGQTALAKRQNQSSSALIGLLSFLGASLAAQPGTQLGGYLWEGSWQPGARHLHRFSPWHKNLSERTLCPPRPGPDTFCSEKRRLRGDFTILYSSWKWL